MTAQQQLDAFLKNCEDVRAGYFYSFKKKSSSLRHFIKKLEMQITTNTVKALQRDDYDQTIAELQQKSPKDHVKYVAAIQTLVSVWGTNRDYVASPFGVQTVIKYWNNVKKTLTDTPTKIWIASPYAGFHSMVASHLAALGRTKAGHTLLTGIAAGNYDVTIVDTPLANECGTGGLTHGLNSVAAELYSTNTDNLGAATKAAYEHVSVGGTPRARWLAQKINGTPRYQLKGVPASAPCNLNVTEQQVSAWIGGRGIGKDFAKPADVEQIKNGIILALYAAAKPGKGSGSKVKYALGTANPLNEQRPPAIGLAHELVHAYFNMQGVQPGFELENSTTVLFEYRCVGLGPWATEAISENAIRAQWDDILVHFDEEDVRNKRHVEAREYYSAPD